MADNQNTGTYLMTKPNEPVLQMRQSRAISSTKTVSQDEKQRLGMPFASFIINSLIESDLQHQVWLLTLHGRLHTIPLPSNISSILDIGCGTGAWALAIAQEHPTTQITATDLTPPNITLPPNVTILKLDAEKEWEFKQKFGFIHGRMLTSGIHCWPALLSRCWNYLEPGGWLELLDVCHPFRAEDPTADNTSSDFIRWGQVAEKCWAMNGLDYRATNKHVDRLRGLGFVDVHEEERKWPVGEWSESEHGRRIGALTLSNFSAFLAMAGVSIISQDPSIGTQEAKDLVAHAQRDLMKNCYAKRFYLTM